MEKSARSGEFGVIFFATRSELLKMFRNREKVKKSMRRYSGHVYHW